MFPTDHSPVRQNSPQRLYIFTQEELLQISSIDTSTAELVCTFYPIFNCNQAKQNNPIIKAWK